MDKDRKLILLGDGAFAEIAYEYFTHDTRYQVVAFSVEQAYLKRTECLGLPVVPFEELERSHAPAEHAFYAALVYTQLNRLRTRLYRAAKAKGFTPASYVSPRAFVWRNVELGEHCFIFENNVVQPFVKLGDNVVLWSGNHIGHHTRIGANCFVASHVVMSGFCDVGENCFFGVNSTVADRVRIERDCLVGAQALVTKNLPENQLLTGTKAEASKVSARDYFKVPKESPG